ncbi:unnamed protein product [Effrenium voratum]|nr:unnamed protein product [Effrenium voratum]
MQLGISKQEQLGIPMQFGLPPPEDHFTKTALASLLDAQEDVKRLLSSLCHKFEALHAERAIERPEKLPEKKHRGSLSKQRSTTLASLQGSEPRRIQANRGERGSKPHTRHRQHQRRCVCPEFHALQEVAQEADLRRSARGLRQARFFGRAGRARPARRHAAGAQPRTGAAAGAPSLALERRGGQRLRLGGLIERHAPGGKRGESIGMLDSLPHSLHGEKAHPRSHPRSSRSLEQDHLSSVLPAEQISPVLVSSTPLPRQASGCLTVPYRATRRNMSQCSNNSGGGSGSNKGTPHTSPATRAEAGSGASTDAKSILERGVLRTVSGTIARKTITSLDEICGTSTTPRLCPPSAMQ